MKKSILISFLGFVLVLITTIIIIFFANGYTLNLDSKTIQKTGVIKITSTPSGTDVYINNKNEGKSPVSVFNLVPGEYALSIKKDGFVPWTTKITVQGGKINLVYPILFPSSIKPTRQESLVNVGATFFGKNNYVYETKDKTAGMNVYFHSFGSGFLNIGDNTQFLFNTNILNINSAYMLKQAAVAPNSTRALFDFSAPNLPEKYFVFNTDGSGQAIDISNFIDPTMYSTVEWGKDDSHIVLFNSQMFISIDITDGQKILLTDAGTTSQITDVNVSDNVFYVIKKTNNQNPTYSVSTVQFDGTNETTIITSTTPIKNFISTGDDYSYSLEGKDIEINAPEISPNHLQVINNISMYPLSYSPDGKYILYRDVNGTMYTYSIETNESFNLNLRYSDVTYFIWDKSSRIILYTTKDQSVTSGTYYDIKAVNFDGSNNDTLLSTLITSPNILLSPNASDIYFEMANLTQDNSPLDKGIYSISIQGL